MFNSRIITQAAQVSTRICRIVEVVVATPVGQGVEEERLQLRIRKLPVVGGSVGIGEGKGREVAPVGEHQLHPHVQGQLAVVPEFDKAWTAHALGQVPYPTLGGTTLLGHAVVPGHDHPVPHSALAGSLQFLDDAGVLVPGWEAS